MSFGKNLVFKNKPAVLSYASVGGKKEGEGPLGDNFDVILPDSLFGEKSYEKAESQMQKTAVMTAIKKANINTRDVDAVFGGDLLNQCIGSSFASRNTQIPFLGVYGACSTMALTLGLSAVFVDSGFAKHAVAVTSSHFCSAERQYRFPLEYGSQRTPTAQWTATAAGAVVLSAERQKAYIDKATFGIVQDLGVKDANNMGAAMAPAAADTIMRFLRDTDTNENDYDAIFTGDLGFVGTTLFYQILEKEGINIRKNHHDCGLMIFDRATQDVHSGGSGCGCSAGVLTSTILKKVESGEYKNILFCATGALLSPTSTMQGETIPSVAHLVNIKSNLI